MEQNFEVIKNETKRERVKEVVDKSKFSRQTDPIVRKLLDFGNADKTCKFSVRDLFNR